MILRPHKGVRIRERILMNLKNKKIVIFVEHHYQDLEVWVPYYRLKEEGAEVLFAGTTATDYVGKYGYPVKAHLKAEGLKAKDFDAVIIPGGWAPDFLRRYEAVLKFVKEMDQSGKIVAAICHAGWVLASCGIAKGRTLTCFSAIKDDLIHAGAKYVDQEVAVDRNLITSRTPDDLPAFCREIIKALSPSHKTRPSHTPSPSDSPLLIEGNSLPAATRLGRLTQGKKGG